MRMSVSMTAGWRSFRRYRASQWLAAARLMVAKRIVQAGWYKRRDVSTTRRPGRLFTFRLQQSEYFDGQRFRIDSHDIPFSHGMDWQQSRREALVGIRLRGWSWLRTEGLKEEHALGALLDFIATENGFTYRAEPYELSLRIQHACWWLGYHDRADVIVMQYIADAAARLRWLTEEHLSNNHLLENGFALCWAGLILDNASYRSRGLDILRTAWQSQVLPSGSHSEQSPMYQHILLARCIESIALMRNCSKETEAGFLVPVVASLAGWLSYLQWRNGAFPVINDSVERPLPEFSELSAALRALGIDQQQPVVAGPQVRLTNDSFECCFDVSGMEPAHCPGHAHSDSLQLLLNVHGESLLVDPGTSTYAAGEQRSRERSVYFHNTVHQRGDDPAELLGAFRLGRSPGVKLMNVSVNEVLAELTSTYRHQRQVQLNSHELKVVDEISSEEPAFACWLVDKKTGPVLKNGMLTTKFVTIQFHGVVGIELSEFQYAVDFGLFKEAVAVKVEFRRRLETRFILREASMS